MHKCFRNMYSGQAIAIVMVILVVASVLGMSLFSRTLKNSQSVIDRQDSDVALEQVDAILDLTASQSDFEILSTLSETEGGTVYTSLGEFATAAGIEESLLTSVPWCEEAGALEESDTGSALKITVGQTDPGEQIDVLPGGSRSFNFEGATVTSPCGLPIFVEPTEGNSALFTIKRVYMDVDGNVKDYDNDDMLAYCVHREGFDCDDYAAPTGSLIDVITGSEISVPITSVEVAGITYDLYELKVIPLSGDIAVSFDTAQPSGCLSNVNLAYVKVNVAVNCLGSYREKQMVLPNSSNLGYSTIFDYTIYNSGTLSPK